MAEGKNPVPPLQSYKAIPRGRRVECAIGSIVPVIPVPRDEAPAMAADRMRTLDAHRNFGIIQLERDGCAEMNQPGEATLGSALKPQILQRPTDTRNDVPP